MYKYLLDHPSFSGMKLLLIWQILYHQQTITMVTTICRALFDFGNKRHVQTIHLIVRLLIPLYLSIQASPTGFLWESYQTPSRSDGCLIVSDKFPATLVHNTPPLDWSIERSCQAAGHLTSTCFEVPMCMQTWNIGRRSQPFFVLFCFVFKVAANYNTMRIILPLTYHTTSTV